MRLINLDIEIQKLKNEAELLFHNGKLDEANALLFMIQFLENNAEIAFDYEDVYKKLEHKMWNTASSSSYNIGKFYAYEDSLNIVKDGRRGDNQ